MDVNLCNAHTHYMEQISKGSYVRIIDNNYHNKNRKLRLWSFSTDIKKWNTDTSIEPSPFLRVGSIRFVKKDKSVYLITQPTETMKVQVNRENKIIANFITQPGNGAHISFHESGVVNVHGSNSEPPLRVREAKAIDTSIPLFTCGFRNLNIYKNEEKKNENGVIISSNGPADWPVFISMFQLDSETALEDEKPYIILSPHVVEYIVSISSDIRYVFNIWRAPIETFNSIVDDISADFIVLPGLPPGVIIRKPD